MEVYENSDSTSYSTSDHSSSSEETRSVSDTGMHTKLLTYYCVTCKLYSFNICP